MGCADDSLPPEDDAPHSILQPVVVRRRGFLREPVRFGRVELFRNDPLFRFLSRLNYVDIYGVLLLVCFGGTAAFAAAAGDLLPVHSAKPGYIRFGLLEDYANLIILPFAIPLCGVFMVLYFRMVPITFRRLVDNGTITSDLESLTRAFENYRWNWVFRSPRLTIYTLALVVEGLILSQALNLVNLMPRRIHEWMVHFDDHAFYTPAYYFLYSVVGALLTSLMLCVIKYFALVGFLFHVFRKRRAECEVSGRSACGTILNWIRIRLIPAPIGMPSKGGGFRIRVRPLHPDGTGGLKPLGRFCMSLHLIVLMVGIIIAATMYKQGVAWQMDPLSLKATIVSLVIYGLTAPALFFLPLWSVHSQMRDAKREALRLLAPRMEKPYETVFERLRSEATLPESTTREVKVLRELHDLARSMPIWPFNPRNVAFFLATVAIPLIVQAVARFLHL